MSSSFSKILETGINVFKSNSQMIKHKNIIKYTYIKIYGPFTTVAGGTLSDCLVKTKKKCLGFNALFD